MLQMAKEMFEIFFAKPNWQIVQFFFIYVANAEKFKKKCVYVCAITAATKHHDFNLEFIGFLWLCARERTELIEILKHFEKCIQIRIFSFKMNASDSENCLMIELKVFNL